jgi:hypothetical protein
MSDLVQELRTSAKSKLWKGRIGANEMNRAADEIERLRDSGIEELEDEAIHNEGVMVALKEGYTEAMARVEELEKTLVKYQEVQEKFIQTIENKNKRIEELERTLEPVHRPGENWWSCLIGPVETSSLRGGSDPPMRKGVEDAFLALTGLDANYCFSGWGAAPTKIEREAVIGGEDE